ncbi:MAG: segregation/condensation protein A [Coriobacteriales bacterium]|nr:segregation/condensation protein A [Coriobacteriales bacterium]
MSYRVSTRGFEGPFDLLLRLVTQQRIEIGAVSISQIADQYLAEVQRLGQLDLEVASDFVLVAATLLDLKAASLIPQEQVGAESEEDDEFFDMSPSEIREVLIKRLLAYRQFKTASQALAIRQETESCMHPRTAGADPEFLAIVPDYLENVELETLAKLCAGFLARRETFLLQSEHIAAKRIPLETKVEVLDGIIRDKQHTTFEELLHEDPGIENRVVSLLALLELNKRGSIEMYQPALFGDISIDAVQGAAAFVAREQAHELTTESSSH